MIENLLPYKNTLTIMINLQQKEKMCSESNILKHQKELLLVK